MEIRLVPLTERQTEGLKGLAFNWMHLSQITFLETLQASNPLLYTFYLASKLDAGKQVERGRLKAFRPSVER